MMALVLENSACSPKNIPITKIYTSYVNKQPSQYNNI